MIATEIKARYAAEVLSTAKITSARLLRALATVSREEFVGCGPWKAVWRPAPGQTRLQPCIAEVSDPAELYQDVAIILGASRNLANGMPSTLAPWIDALALSEGKTVFHLGCGTGYYTAVIAELVGRTGRVTAIEIDAALATQARKNLARYANIEVVEGDGGVLKTAGCDAILVNAGVTHPADNWLDGLHSYGNLVMPLTVDFGIPNVGKGMVLHLRRTERGYAARFLPDPVMIYSSENSC